jgi:hypothetical protein
LEAINLKASLKIELMMAIVVFLYALCIRQGLLVYQHFKKPKKSDYKQFAKKTKPFQTLAVSVFRKGIAYLENLFFNLSSFIQFLHSICRGEKPDFFIHVQ